MATPHICSCYSSPTAWLGRSDFPSIISSVFHARHQCTAPKETQFSVLRFTSPELRSGLVWDDRHLPAMFHVLCDTRAAYFRASRCARTLRNASSSEPLKIRIFTSYTARESCGRRLSGSTCWHVSSGLLHTFPGSRASLPQPICDPQRAWQSSAHPLVATCSST